MIFESISDDSVPHLSLSFFMPRPDYSPPHATLPGLLRGAKIHILTVQGIDPSSFILLQQLITIDQTGGGARKYGMQAA